MSLLNTSTEGLPMADDQEYGGGESGKRAAEDQRQNQNKRPRGDYNQVIFRLLIRSFSAGGVIGKGGENIKRLRSDNDAKISIPDCNGPERIIKIVTKNLDNALDCIRDIIPSICEKMQSQEQNNSMVRIMVHQSHAGAIIGRAGFKIKELREKTGAVFKVFTDTCPKSTDRVVQLSGNPDVIIKAAAEVYNICTDTPVKGPVQEYDPFCYNLDYCDKYGGYLFDQSEESGEHGGGRWGRSGPPMRGPPRGHGGFDYMGGNDNFGYGRSPFGSGGSGGPRGMGMRGGRSGRMGRGGRGGARGGFGEAGFDTGPQRGSSKFGSSEGYSSSSGASSGESVQTQQVTIPIDLVGSIIGKGGERIKKIRNKSQAQIKIADPQPGAKDRVITITGMPSCIANAKFLLQSTVREYQSVGEENQF